MKNFCENLLTVAIEECSEIQFEICKSLRFGLNEKYQNDTETKAEKIMREYYELQATLGLLIENGFIKDLDPAAISSIKARKRIRIIDTYNEYINKAKIEEEAIHNSDLASLGILGIV